MHLTAMTNISHINSSIRSLASGPIRISTGSKNTGVKLLSEPETHSKLKGNAANIVNDKSLTLFIQQIKFS